MRPHEDSVGNLGGSEGGEEEEGGRIRYSPLGLLLKRRWREKEKDFQSMSFSDSLPGSWNKAIGGDCYWRVSYLLELTDFFYGRVLFFLLGVLGAVFVMFSIRSPCLVNWAEEMNHLPLDYSGSFLGLIQCILRGIDLRQRTLPTCTIYIVYCCQSCSLQHFHP